MRDQKDRSPLPGQFLCGLPEHVLARLLVERFLHELSYRKTRLHLRPGPDLRVPPLYVGIIVETEALALLRHGPGKAGAFGASIVARDVSPGLPELCVEHPIKPRRFIAIAFDGIGDLLMSVERKVAVLAEHRTKSTHLPHHPLNDLRSSPHFLR